MNDADLNARVAEVIGARQSDKQILEFGLFDPLNNPADTWMVLMWMVDHNYSVTLTSILDMRRCWIDDLNSSYLEETDSNTLARALCEAVVGLLK